MFYILPLWNNKIFECCVASSKASVQNLKEWKTCSAARHRRSKLHLTPKEPTWGRGTSVLSCQYRYTRPHRNTYCMYVWVSLLLIQYWFCLLLQITGGPMVQVRLCAVVTVPAVTVSTDTLQFDTVQCDMCQVMQYDKVEWQDTVMWRYKGCCVLWLNKKAVLEVFMVI